MMIDRHIEKIGRIVGFPVELLRKTFVCLNINNINNYINNYRKDSLKPDDFPGTINLPWVHVWAEYNVGNLGNHRNKLISNLGVMGLRIEKSSEQIFYIFGESYTKKDCLLLGTMTTKDINNDTYVNMKAIDGSADGRIANGKLMIPFYLAIAFCHCKNISLNKEEISPKMDRAAIKRGRLPFFRFNTIIINPMQEILKKEGQSETLGLKKALHICRGHFATYTVEAPLFGKTVGTFWKPMHLKGNKKEGVVIKDYKIAAPR